MKDGKVYVVWAPKQYRILGVYTNARKAAAAREHLQRDGVPAEIRTHTVNEESDGETAE